MNCRSIPAMPCPDTSRKAWTGKEANDDEETNGAGGHQSEEEKDGFHFFNRISKRNFKHRELSHGYAEAPGKSAKR